MRAIAYLNDRPWLDYSLSRLGVLVRDIETLYRDLLENTLIEIKDEFGNLLLSLPPRKANRDPCRQLYAEELSPPNSSQTVYLDQYGFVTTVL